MERDNRRAATDAILIRAAINGALTKEGAEQFKGLIAGLMGD